MRKRERVLRIVVLCVVAFSLFGCSLTVNGCQVGAGQTVNQSQSGPVSAGLGEGDLLIAVFGFLAVLILACVLMLAGRDGLGPGPGDYAGGRR